MKCVAELWTILVKLNGKSRQQPKRKKPSIVEWDEDVEKDVTKNDRIRNSKREEGWSGNTETRSRRKYWIDFFLNNFFFAGFILYSDWKQLSVCFLYYLRIPGTWGRRNTVAYCYVTRADEHMGVMKETTVAKTIDTLFITSVHGPLGLSS